MTPMITLLLAEDEPMVRRGLRMWLNQAPDITIVAEASSGEEAIILAQAYQPDVVLMDIAMSAGLAATTILRAAAPRSMIVFLSLHDDPIHRAQAYTAGASVFVGKQEGVVALLTAIRQARKQERSLRSANDSPLDPM